VQVCGSEVNPFEESREGLSFECIGFPMRGYVFVVPNDLIEFAVGVTV